jgi:uncharacterized membrane protein YbhN (UPF0104 family)
VQPWHARHPIAISALAIALASAGVMLIAWLTGTDQGVGAALERIHPEWIALIAVAEALTYPAYSIAYRSVARVHGHETLDLPIVGRVVAAGFGPFHLAGGFGVDRRALHALHEDERSARVRVLGLGALEWALLAPVTCVIAIVFLITGEDVLTSLLWPWALAVPVGFAIGLWASAPARRERLRRIRPGRRAWLADLLDGIGVLHTLIAHPRKYAGAWIGTACYWLVDIAAFYGALRTFGLDPGIAKTILAYATGYAATRRSLPLGGAGVTEVLMTYALYWVRLPLGPALGAVVAYRSFNLLLATLPALLARRHVESLVAEHSRARG